MIDGLKTKGFKINDYNQLALEWTQSTNEATGEITRHTKINGLTIYQTKEFGMYALRGSIHKFHTGGLHNHSDYGFKDIVHSISSLCRLLKKEPEEIKLKKIEFGVNAGVRQDPLDYINAFVAHKTSSFAGYSPDRHPYTIGAVSKHQQYLIKAYSKSAQYGLFCPLLRFEISVNRMQYFKDRQIKLTTLADLLCLKTIEGLGKILISSLDDLLMIDNSVDDCDMPQDQKDLVNKFINNRAMKPFIPQSKDFKYGNKDPQYQRKRKRFYSHKKKVISIINEYGLSSLHTELRRSVEKKVNKLIPGY